MAAYAATSSCDEQPGWVSPDKDVIQRPCSQASTAVGRSPTPGGRSTTPGAWGGRSTTPGGGARSATPGADSVLMLAPQSFSAHQRPQSAGSWISTPAPYQGSPCTAPTQPNHGAYRRPYPGHGVNSGGGCMPPSSAQGLRHERAPRIWQTPEARAVQRDAAVARSPIAVTSESARASSKLVLGPATAAPGGRSRSSSPERALVAAPIAGAAGNAARSLGSSPDMLATRTDRVVRPVDLLANHPWADPKWDNDENTVGWKDLHRRPLPTPGTLLNKAVRTFQRPGALWDPNLWAQARHEAVTTGDFEGVNYLGSLVRFSTERALRSGEYLYQPAGSPKSFDVDLASVMQKNTTVNWFGDANTERPPPLERSGASLPSMLISDSSPIDIAVNLRRKAGPMHPIILVVEIMDFDETTGRMDLRSANAVAPHDLLLRSDFARYCERAHDEIDYCKVPRVKSHMRQPDPYIMYIQNVTIFRGSHEEGYPFYEEPVQVHVIAYSLLTYKPEVQVIVRRKYGTTEWYASQADHSSLIERLNLIARVGHKMESEPPSLIFTMPGCLGPALQPRDAVGNSFKHWKRMWSQYFHSVFLCCRGRRGGDADTASHLNRIINRYKSFSADILAASASNWNLSLEQLQMMVQKQDVKKLEIKNNELDLQRDKQQLSSFHETRHAVAMEMTKSVRASLIIQTSSIKAGGDLCFTKVEVESNSSSDGEPGTPPATNAQRQFGDGERFMDSRDGVVSAIGKQTPEIEGQMALGREGTPDSQMDCNFGGSSPTHGGRTSTPTHGGRTPTPTKGLKTGGSFGGSSGSDGEDEKVVQRESKFKPSDLVRGWYKVVNRPGHHGQQSLKAKLREMMGIKGLKSKPTGELESNQPKTKKKKKRRPKTCEPDSPSSPGRSTSPMTSQPKSAPSKPTRPKSASSNNLGSRPGSALEAVSELEPLKAGKIEPNKTRAASPTLGDSSDEDGEEFRQVVEKTQAQARRKSCELANRGRMGTFGFFGDASEKAPSEDAGAAEWKQSMQEQRRHSLSIQGIVGANIQVFDRRDVAAPPKSTGSGRRTSAEKSRTSVTDPGGEAGKERQEQIRIMARQSLLIRKDDTSGAGDALRAALAVATHIESMDEEITAADKDADGSDDEEEDEPGSPAEPAEKVPRPSSRNKEADNLEITLAGLAGQVDRMLEERRAQKRHDEAASYAQKQEAHHAQVVDRAGHKPQRPTTKRQTWKAQGAAMSRVSSTRNSSMPIPRCSVEQLGQPVTRAACLSGSLNTSAHR